MSIAFTIFGNDMNKSVQFVFLIPATLTNRNVLKQFIIRIFKREKVRLAALSIIFCSDSYVLDLNKRFLKHDYYTDILSFTLSAPGEPLEAEIYISIDRVKENAVSQGVSFQQELHRVVFHGILHFSGYKDKTEKQIKEIRSIEDKYLRRYGFRLNPRSPV